MGNAYLFREEKLQIRHKSLIVYTQTHFDSLFPRKIITNLSDYSKQGLNYSGSVSYHVRRRINHAIHKLLLASPPIEIYNPVTLKVEIFTINFITLTIPTNQVLIDTKEGYELLLKPFLRTMRRKYNLKSYIWKAELQNRGQLHYHLTTNTWINWVNIRNEWNYLLRRNNLMDEYISEHGSDNPNSTDVHKIYKIKNIASYLSKYISKDIAKTTTKFGKFSNEIRYNNDLIVGCMISCCTLTITDDLNFDSKVWDCSKDIKLCKLPTIVIDDALKSELLFLKYQKKISDTNTEFCNIIEAINYDLNEIAPSAIKDALLDYSLSLNNIRNGSKEE
jgi:hypothetical protein